MEELLIEFEKNGAVKSIVANYIWKWGCAIATIWYLIKVLVLGGRQNVSMDYVSRDNNIAIHIKLLYFY